MRDETSLRAPRGLLVLLAGCSDGDPEPKIAPADSSSAASSTSPTPSPSASGPVEPSLPAEAEGEDAAAAEAFVRHFWSMVNYAQATGDVVALRGLSVDSCESCVSGSDWIESVYAAGGRIDGGEYTITELTTTPLAAGSVKLFKVRASVVTTDQTVSGAGKLDETFPAGRGKVDLTILAANGELKVSDWEGA